MKIQIARNGEVIGEFTIMELRLAVKIGTVSEEDFAWAEGWTEWKPVKGLAELAKAREGKPPKAPKAPKPPQPATEKQIAYITSFGAEVKAGLTKAEASAMLDKLTTDPRARERQKQLNEEKSRLLTIERESYPSYYYRIDIDNARRELERATKEIETYAAKKAEIKTELAKQKADLASATEALSKATDATQIEEWKEEIENCKEQIQNRQEEWADCIESEKDDKGNLKDYKEELNDAVKYRVEFWKDTFRDNPEEFSEAGGTLNAHYGQFLKVPTNKEVSEILEALDRQMPGWDKGHAPSFFSTYQATFPDRLKQSAVKQPARKVSAKKSSSGCLALLAAPIFLYLIFRFAPHSLFL